MLDSPPEEGFDRITRLAARALEAPVSVVSLVDDRRQFLKSALGLDGPLNTAQQTSLSYSFCRHVVASAAPLVVDDATAHPVVRDNPAVREFGVMAYLGVPIRSPDGFVLGTLCVVESKPRAWSEREVGLLNELAGMLDAEIALRAAAMRDETTLTRLRAVLNGTAFSVIATSPEGVIEMFNTGAEQMLGYTADEVVGRETPVPIHVGEEMMVAAAALSAELGREIAPDFAVLATLGQLGRAAEREWTYVRKDGSRLPVLASVTALRDAGGTLTGFLVIARDIAVQKRVEQEMRDILAREQIAHREAENAKAYFRSLFESGPGLYLVLTPEDFQIVGASEAYLRATRTRRDQLVGKRLFQVFPDDPGDPIADGVRNLRASLERVKSSQVADAMAVQRYPIPRPESEGGGFEERFWSPLNSPLIGPDGALAYIIHRAEDVTEIVRRKQREDPGDETEMPLASHTERMELDIVLRSQELQRLNEKLRASEEASGLSRRWLRSASFRRICRAGAFT